MKAFYFTFGIDHKFKEMFQQVIAVNIQLAVTTMDELYSGQWVSAYTQEEFEGLLKQEEWSVLKPLPPIYIGNKNRNCT